jgi:Skp family chaperone for outer membrane proteins
MPIRMTRVTPVVLALFLTGAPVFAHDGPRPTGQQTTPPPATPPATAQTPAPKPATPAPPPAPVFPAGATVGYVQIQAVIASSKIGKCGSVQMKALKDKDQAALAVKEKELQTQQQKMQAQQGLVSDAVMVQMQRDFEKIQRDLQTMQQQFSADEENKNQDLLNDLQVKVGPLLEALRKDKDLSLILSAQPGGTILAANTALDLSVELVKRLDAAFPEPCKATQPTESTGAQGATSSMNRR